MLQQSRSSASQVDARRFDGKVALVTGASRGIGRQVCVQLVEEGCRVFGVARSVESLAELNNSFKDSFSGFALDVANAQACREGVKTAWDAFGRIDLVVNCAGVARPTPFLEVTPEDWDAHYATNVRGPMFLTQAVAKLWATNPSQSGRAVVNISSVPSGRWAMPHRAAYCSSKGALNQLTRCMALELGPLGVRVNAVSPTVTMTDMGRQAWADPAKSAPMLGRIPLGRFPEPSDVADAVLFLLSDECKMVHGQDLAVDGGFTAVGSACLPLSSS